MKNSFCQVLAVVLSFMMPAIVLGDAGSTALIGMVRNNQNQPVSGLKVLAKVSSGQIVSQGTTDALGRYAVQNLLAGRYQLTLDTANSPYKGQTVVSAVGDKGLTVDWLVSESAPALAMATPGTNPDPPAPAPASGTSGAHTGDLDPLVKGGLIFLGTSGTIVGIAAGAGAFAGGPTGRVSTASK